MAARTEIENPQIQAARYGMLSEVVLLISETPDVQQLIEQLIQKVKWVLDFNRCTLALLNEGGDTYRLQALLETRRKIPNVDQSEIPLAHGIMGEVMRSQKIQWITEPATSKSDIHHPVDVTLWDGSINAILSLPLSRARRRIAAG